MLYKLHIGIYIKHKYVNRRQTKIVMICFSQSEIVKISLFIDYNIE